ncbi:hypothetical protein GE21DRAFT_1255508 [Neurospora crassa]|nr:hypothetical protein B8B20.100 [imported] - Neurospora crassa [Neurospora crassa]KHE85254.1 hypothetical protein GE21DRAFT_1255508 [Neurospora crassa]
MPHIGILSARKLQHSCPPSHVPSRASPLHLQYISRSSSPSCHHQETNPVPSTSCRMAEWRSGLVYCCAHANSRVRRFETNRGKDSQTNKSELKRSSYCYKRLLGNKKPIKDKSAMLLSLKVSATRAKDAKRHSAAKYKTCYRRSVCCIDTCVLQKAQLITIDGSTIDDSQKDLTLGNAIFFDPRQMELPSSSEAGGDNGISEGTGGKNRGRVSCWATGFVSVYSVHTLFFFSFFFFFFPTRDLVSLCFLFAIIERRNDSFLLLILFKCRDNGYECPMDFRSRCVCPLAIDRSRSALVARG